MCVEAAKRGRERCLCLCVLGFVGMAEHAPTHREDRGRDNTRALAAGGLNRGEERGGQSGGGGGGRNGCVPEAWPCHVH